MKKQEVSALQSAKENAYSAWRNKIKELMSDGVVREVEGEDTEEELDGEPFNGLVVNSNGFDYHVDKIKYNVSNSQFMLHVVAKDYRKADEWLSEYNFPRFSYDGMDKVLESIVWED